MNQATIERISGWTEEEIDQLKLTFLNEIINCRDSLSVDAAISYAKFISRKVKIDPDNYPVFMLILESGNHWVIDALIGNNNPETFFGPVQPNRFLLTECFKMLTRWKKNSIYAKSLLVIFGLLKVSYENPHEGYRLYPLSIADLNNMGKHLDKSHGQNNPINQIILSLLDKIDALTDPGIPVTDDEILKVSTQANNIRGKFLDATKHLNEAIPDQLIEQEDSTEKEVSPTKTTK
ncbi:MAG: hypothetical protein IEMM0008_0394 [bacterium]|nr:MAG: hypothetical protein IEMM0008_0394 [bacterium]